MLSRRRIVTAASVAPHAGAGRSAAPERETRALPGRNTTSAARRRTDTPKTSAGRAGVLGLGVLIADRYEVAEGPLGSRSGEAEVYRCWDKLEGGTVAVKLYRSGCRPKQEVLAHLKGLVHQDVVAVRDFGEHDGRFLEVMEFCAGGTMADLGRAPETVITSYLPQILGGLAYCHERGLVHRDVKPSNLLFRDVGRKDLVLGDFGISSEIEPARGERTTGTATRRTTDYTPPEAIADHRVGPFTDYYALGITLLHLAAGRSPFDGIDDDGQMATLAAQGRIPWPAGLGERFAGLCRGLLALDSKQRWGAGQVRAWLDGRQVPAPVPRAWPRPFKPRAGGPTAETPRELAKHLDQFDAAGELFRGRISTWVELGDKSLAEKIERLEEDFADRRELGVFTLRCVLDPNLPLVIAGRAAVDIRGLRNALRSGRDDARVAVAGLLYGQMLESWLRHALVDDSGSADLMATAARIRTTIPDRGLGVLALWWSLDSGATFEFSGRRVSTPRELATLVERNPDLREAASALLDAPALETWLVYSGRVEDNSALLAARTRTREATVDVRAEVLVRFLDDELPDPVVRVEPGELVVRTGVRGTVVSLSVHGEGRGHLYGLAQVEDPDAGVVLEDEGIEGRTVLSVRIAPRGVLDECRTALVLRTNGGELRVPVSYSVRAPWVAMLARSLLSALVFSAILFGLRLLLGKAAPSATGSVPWVRWDVVEGLTASAHLIPVFVVVAGAVALMTYYVIRVLGR